MADKKSQKLIENEALMKEWDWDRNNEINLKPGDLYVGSNKRVWWKCNRNHSFEKSIRDMIAKPQCPKCKEEILSLFPKQITKNQHYVQQKYLRQWGVDENKKQTYCSHNYNESVPIKSICQEKYFYKIEPINKTEYNFIVDLISVFPDKNKIEEYIKVLKYYLYLNDFNFAGTEFEKPVEDLYAQTGEEITKIHEEVLSNDIIDSLIKCDDDFMLNIEKKYSLLSYAIFQFFRTKKARNKLQDNIKNIISNGKLTDLRPAVISKHLADIFGNMTVDTLIDHDFHILFLKNKNNTFITSDNPVFVINEIDLDKIDDFLYIVSPSLAIIISTNKNYSGIKTISDEEVELINNLVVDNSNTCIISNSLSLLKKYKHKQL